MTGKLIGIHKFSLVSLWCSGASAFERGHFFLRQASKETSSEADKDGCTDAAEAGPSLHA